MNTTAMAPQPNHQGRRDSEARGSRVAHDNWMADGDRFLLPVADADATFWERWAAMRYVEDQLLHAVSH